MLHFFPKKHILRYVVISSVLCIAVMQNAHAQDTSSVSGDTVKMKMGKPNVIYHCWVFGNDSVSDKMRRGFMHSTADSGIVFSLAAKGNNFVPKNRVLIYRDVSSIDKIKIRRKGGVRKGIVIGAGAGFLIGAALGLAGIPEYGVLDNLPPEENAAAGGIIFSIPGMIIGGVIGSFRIKIPLNRNQQQYEKYRKVIASHPGPVNP